MKNYELTYIISSDITIEEADAKAKEIELLIQEKGGVIIKSEKPTAKTLSYQIKKFGSGFFVVVNFQAIPDTINEIKENIIKKDKIIRYIILIKKTHFKQKRQRTRLKTKTEETTDPIKEKIEEKIEPQEEKKPNVKKVKSSKNKEKSEIEEIDKKLEEILSE